MLRDLATMALQYVLIVSFFSMTVVGLHFDTSGKFKILQVADMNYAMGAATVCKDILQKQKPCSDLNTTAFLKRVISAENPNLIVFTGNNVDAWDVEWDLAHSLDAAFRPAVKAKIPWAALLGPDDVVFESYEEKINNRLVIMNYIVNMKYSVTILDNPEADSDCPEAATEADCPADAFRNYFLEIAKDGKTNDTALDLFFLDLFVTHEGNSFDTQAMDLQKQWIKETNANLVKQRNNGNANVPMLAFFHTPLLEYANITDYVGSKHENVTPTASGFMDTLVELGRVKATFAGHDHTNDFCGNVKDIYLCYGGGFGYHGYGKVGWPRRARIVEITLNKSFDVVSNISTWKRLDDKNLTVIDEEVLWLSHTPPPSLNAGKQLPSSLLLLVIFIIIF